MKIDPATKEITLTAEELSNILLKIDSLSETVINLVDLLKSGPVKYPEFEKSNDYPSFLTNYSYLEYPLLNDFPLINHPGDNS